MSSIFGAYDQAALDREYDNRAKIGDKLNFYLDSYAAGSLSVRASMPSSQNISYGPSGPETLDIFPAPVDGAQPVQIFIHGGYWKTLDSKDFSFVVRAFRPRGVLSVVVNYGLMPQISMAGLVAQCTRAVAWVQRNIADYGGDPERIFLSGHSAGGHLAAMMLVADWPALGLSSDVIKGAVGISGLYDLEPVQKCFVNQELGLSDADVDDFSPVRHHPAGPAPLILTVGANEGPEYLRQSREMAAAWESHGIQAQYLPMANHDHFSIILELNDPDSALTGLICRQMSV